MMLLYNQFAFIPRLYLEGKRYIWFKGYRKAKIWNKTIDRPIKENICKSCLTKFDVGEIDEKNNG